MSSFASLFSSAIVFGTILMLGAMGEILTEKSGHLNLGVPGLMFLGGYAGFASAFLYEKSTENPSIVLMIIIPLITSFGVSALGGLLYSFFTVTLRANQNVTGLALTYIGVGIGSFGGVFTLLKAGYSSYAKAGLTYDIFSANINTYLNFGVFGQLFLSYGFMIYIAIGLAIFLQLFLKKTRVGLNLRAVGENPATADAAGINVTKYKYFSTVIGAGICGLGGLIYIIIYKNGGWSTTNDIEALGWLSVALVIFATWKPINTIWGSYLFAFLFWIGSYAYQLTGISLTTYQKDLLKILPYLFTILILIIISLRKKRENQPPASLGLAYFREDR